MLPVIIGVGVGVGMVALTLDRPPCNIKDDEEYCKLAAETMQGRIICVPDECEQYGYDNICSKNAAFVLIGSTFDSIESIWKSFTKSNSNSIDPYQSFSTPSMWRPWFGSKS